MARYLGPKAKLSRREGTDLFLKSARRSIADKSKFDSKPGQHGRTSGQRTSDYGLQLREKQKVKRYYGLQERQFMNYFREAERLKGDTGENLLGLLERRLDNVVWKSGFAPSHKASRQTVVHGHIHVNGRRVNRPSYLVREGDRITVKPVERSKGFIHATLGEGVTTQAWLQVDPQRLEAVVAALPTREDVQIPVEAQLIIEMCSR